MEIAIQILLIIGSLGLFIFGMKSLSDALNRVAGSRLKSSFQTMTSTRLSGVATGFLITAVIQSSSATSIMIVSFANAGLLTLLQATGVIMGANIGTTLTGWLVSVVGFEFDLSELALLFFALAFPLFIQRNSQRKRWAEVFIGLGILLLGLHALKESVPDLSSNRDLFDYLNSFSKVDFLNRLFFVLVGFVITVIVQSSSAAMTLTIVMVTQGLPLEIAAAMVLGENIGTTVTAEIAALVGNVHGKRVARVHTLFNIFGVLWMVILLPYTLDGLKYLLPQVFGQAGDPFVLAGFHTVFNILNTILFLIFTKFLIQSAIRTVRSKGTNDEEFHLQFIQSPVGSSPELSIMEAGLEVHRFARITNRMVGILPKLIVDQGDGTFDPHIEKIANLEDTTDKMELEIANFLTRVSEGEISESNSLQIRKMISVVNELERVGDICFQVAEQLRRKRDQRAYFKPEQRSAIEKMMKLIQNSGLIMEQNLSPESGKFNMESARDLENQINSYRDELRQQHLKSMEKGQYKVETSLIFNNLVNSLEKLADHQFNVSVEISGKEKPVQA